MIQLFQAYMRGRFTLVTNRAFGVFEADDFIGREFAIVSTLTEERIASHPIPERGFWQLSPDLVVEIVSPDDTAEELAEKVGTIPYEILSRINPLLPRSLV